jgi:hypothetical protein
VAIVVTDGFEQVELEKPKEALEQAASGISKKKICGLIDFTERIRLS